MTAKKFSRSAFSLIELSIVILIVGVLIAGVTQGSKMIKESRRATAQTLTQSSPVNDTPDLALWYETSLSSSFIPTEVQEDGGSISTWYDNNSQGVKKNNATQATANFQPKLYENAFYGAISGVRFDGVDDYMDFDGTMVVGISYTVFVVEQRRSSNTDPYFFFAGSGGGSNNNLFLGYGNNTTLYFGHFGNDLTYTIGGYTTTTPRIHSFLFNTTSGKKYYLNGNNVASQPAQTAALITNPGAALGRIPSFFYNGDLAEIIIFTRALRTEERQSIENYLSRKYNITLS